MTDLGHRPADQEHADPIQTGVDASADRRTVPLADPMGIVPALVPRKLEVVSPQPDRDRRSADHRTVRRAGDRAVRVLRHRLLERNDLRPRDRTGVESAGGDEDGRADRRGPRHRGRYPSDPPRSPDQRPARRRGHLDAPAGSTRFPPLARDRSPRPGHHVTADVRGESGIRTRDPGGGGHRLHRHRRRIGRRLLRRKDRLAIHAIRRSPHHGPRPGDPDRPQLECWTSSCGTWR